MSPPLWKTLSLSPWWPLSLLSSEKSFMDNPLIGSRRLNQQGLHAWRVRKTHELATRRRTLLQHRISPEDRATFERDGFVVHHEVLPREQFRRLQETVLGLSLPAREMVQGDAITRRMAVDSDLRNAAPDLATLLDGPLWQGLTRYVGAYDAPPWAYIQSILSHTRDAGPDPQTQLHADTFHPSMKAWYFLTDVAVDEGPFCYVKGSHRLTPERLAWEQRKSLEAADLSDRYSARGSFRIAASELAGLNMPEPTLLAVPANTLVVADTYGFHARGPSVRPSTRVEVWGYDRRNPFLPSTTDLPLQLLGLMDRRPELYWNWLDSLERLGIKRNPWRNKGSCRPADRH